MKRLIFASAAALCAGLTSLGYLTYDTFGPKGPRVLFHTHPQGKYYLQTKEAGHSIVFNLHSPFAAKTPDRESILLGYDIMLHTAKHSSEYDINALSCVNCHFCAGNTTGGKNGSISLVGVVCHYPAYSERDKRMLTIEDRIQNCFMRSLNGKPLPKDSKQMKALVHYFEWISQDVIGFKKIPWLGLRKLKSTHTPDAANGATCFAEFCAPCHGDNGEGSTQAPPLWGDSSFNDGAGMHTLPRLSAFIYDNMPYENPNLTEEQALDIAAFIIKQPRPHFVPPKKTEETKPAEEVSLHKEKEHGAANSPQASHPRAPGFGLGH